MKLGIVGLPNVGKSTFINKVAKRKTAKAEDRPGVTRSKQWVPVDAEKFYSWLHNTPGLKWTDVVAMLVRKLRQTKQLNKQHNNGKDTHNH